MMPIRPCQCDTWQGSRAGVGKSPR